MVCSGPRSRQDREGSTWGRSGRDRGRTAGGDTVVNKGGHKVPTQPPKKQVSKECVGTGICEHNHRRKPCNKLS
jgi:hypothetical protein